MDEDSLDYFLDNNDEFYQTTDESLVDIFNNCVTPSLYSIYDNVIKLILVNLAFGIITSYFKLNESVFHILSGITGIYLILGFVSGYGKYLIIIFFITCYVLLRINIAKQNAFTSQKLQRINFNIIQYCLIVVLVLCQYYFLDSECWMEIRGPMMIFSMKLISISDDMQKFQMSIPTFTSYFGYIFSGANIMFGPWIPFSEYYMAFSKPTKKNKWWILAVTRSLTISLLFLIASNCVIGYLIAENGNRWLAAYGEAISFRSSHYFICYLSESAVLAAGYKNVKIWSEAGTWRYIITIPSDIELPGALAIVVTSWNRPMHDFLKKYVYKTWVPLGKFYGILSTFIISSFLHGFELKVSVVLISIGIFSYTEFLARQIFARAFDCCIKVYPCKELCSHKYKRNDVICLIYRAVFSFISIVHLVFLGMIMDTTTDKVGILAKWSNLYYCSFWIIIFNLLIIL